MKYHVCGADGKYRGGFFDPSTASDFWVGRPGDGFLKTMFCTGAPEVGSWYLLEQSTSPSITGANETDDLVDHTSRVGHRTAPQAFRWFCDQDFGPPPQLAERVTRYMRDWEEFRDSRIAKDMLFDAIGSRKRFVNAPGDSAPETHKRAFELLRNLNLLSEGSSDGRTSYFPCPYARRLGRADSVPWMDAHIDLVRQRLSADTVEDAPGIPAPAIQPEDHAGDNSITLTGDMWTLRYLGKTVHLKDMKGIRYLHKLLAKPHQSIPVEELAGGQHVIATPEDYLLDKEAVRSYAGSLSDIDFRIEEARDDSDEGQIVALEEERERITRQMASDTKLTGQPRRVHNERDSVRSSVGHAIKSALARLSKVHPALHAHLISSLQTPTGLAPCYRPQVTTNWTLE